MPLYFVALYGYFGWMLYPVAATVRQSRARPRPGRNATHPVSVYSHPPGAPAVVTVAFHRRGNDAPGASLRPLSIVWYFFGRQPCLHA